MLFSQTNFERVYGKDYNEEARYVLETYTNNYLILSSNEIPGNTDTFCTNLLMINSLGDSLWSKSYIGAGSSKSACIKQYTDSGFIISGQSNSGGGGGNDMFLQKTNSLGDSLWTKYYGGVGEEKNKAVIPTQDGGFALLGSTNSFGGGWEFYLIKTDSAGNLSWSKTHGKANDDFGCSIQQTFDGGYLLFGHTYNSANFGNELFLIKTDINGDTTWTKMYVKNGNDFGYTVQQTADSGYILLAAYTLPWDTTLALIKTDQNGIIQWTKYPSPGAGDLGVHLEVVGNDLLIVGNSFKVSRNSEVLLIKANSMGDTLWTRTFGGSGNETGSMGTRTSDNGYIIVGNTQGFGGSSFDRYVVKTDSNGNAGCPGQVGFTGGDLVCKGETVTFTNTTITTKKVSWLIDGILFSNYVDASYFFDSAGVFDMQLVVCTDTFTKPVTVINSVDDIIILVDSLTVTFSIDSTVTIDTFYWNFGDTTAIDSVNISPVHTYSHLGTYHVTLSYSNSNGCKNSIGKFLTLVMDNTGEISSQVIQIQLYPNPVSDISTLYIKDPKIREYRIEVRDIMGRLVATYNSVRRRVLIRKEDYVAGMYFYSAINEKGAVVLGKILVQ